MEYQKELEWESNWETKQRVVLLSWQKKKKQKEKVLDLKVSHGILLYSFASLSHNLKGFSSQVKLVRVHVLCKEPNYRSETSFFAGSLLCKEANSIGLSILIQTHILCKESNRLSNHMLFAMILKQTTT